MFKTLIVNTLANLYQKFEPQIIDVVRQVLAKVSEGRPVLKLIFDAIEEELEKAAG